MTTIGERIAKCRREKNFSQEYIAEMLEVSRQAVSKWENNLTEPDTGNLIKLARLFGVSVEYLASGEESGARIEYKGKDLPVLKIIGIILVALGGLSAVLGALLPYMLAVGIVAAAFGVLIITLKRDGVILGASIILLGVVLFLVQGFTGGVDTLAMLLIAAVSVTLPVLSYGLLRLVRAIRSRGMPKFKVTWKRIVFICILLILIAATVISVVLVVRSRRAVLEKARWFSSGRLSEYMLEGLPAPSVNDCISINGEKMLFDFDTEEYNDYLASVYSFLKSRGFKHLGTRGELLSLDGDGVTYELVIPNGFIGYKPYMHEYSGFAAEEVDDYIFVYSNSDVALNGEVECFVIAFNEVGSSTVTVGNGQFSYNVEMSIYRENSREGYKYRSYKIAYNTSYYDLFLPDMPTEAMQGREIRVRTRAVVGLEIELQVNGKPAERTATTSEYREYTFIMPDTDVTVEIVPVGDDPIVPPSLCLASLEVWLVGLDAKDVAEIRTGSVNASVGPTRYFKYIRSTADKQIIEEFIRVLALVGLEAIDAGDAAVDGGGVFTVSFILTDGTEHNVRFEAERYRSAQNEYYEVDVMPSLDSYDGERVTDTLSLALWEDVHTVYAMDGTALASAQGLDELEFCDYVGDVRYDSDDYLYYVETKLGRLYICSDTVFMFAADSSEPSCYELTAGSFYELFGIEQSI